MANRQIGWEQRFRVGGGVVGAVVAMALVSTWAWPVVAAGVCHCERVIAPGVAIRHCSANCASSPQCCSCGILSSQCRCCLATQICVKTGEGSAVAISVCNSPPGP